MDKSTSISKFTLRGLAWQSWLPQVSILIYLLLALTATLAAPILAIDWMEKPFIGAFLEPTMVFNGIDSSIRPSDWPAVNQKINKDYQLRAINGLRTDNSNSLSNSLSQAKTGDAITLTARNLSNGIEQTFNIKLVDFQFDDRIAYFYLPYIIGLIYMASGIWIFSIRRHQTSGRAFVVFAVSMAITACTFFDFYTTHRLSLIWAPAVALVGAGIINLALLFPQEDPFYIRFPNIGIAIYGVAILLGLFTVSQFSNVNNPLAYRTALTIELIFTGVAILFAVLWFLFRKARKASPIEREQIRLIVAGILISIGPAIIWLLISALVIPGAPFSPYLLLPFAIFPITCVYTIQRYRLLQTDFVLSRTFLYGLMAVLIAIGYALLVSGLGLIFVRSFTAYNPIFAGLIIFALALLFNPLRQSLDNVLDALFFRGKRAYQERLQTFSGELTNLVETSAIIKILRQYIERSLMPNQLHIFIYDPLSDQYVATADSKGKVTSDLRFSVTNALVKAISERKASLFFSDPDNLPVEVRPDQVRIALLDAQVFVPLAGRKRLSGWFALGQRLSGEPFTSRELNFLEALSDQASLAIERAQVVVNMENRVREMNVLSRVAQGINITLSLDDILELIYAQTVQIIPADDFHILMNDKESGAFISIFNVEDDERLRDQENRPVARGQELEQEVIRHRRPILTDDYSQECQKQGVLATNNNLYAWMGVPLNAGAETIGALGLGKRNASITYTSEQLNLLQSISDQVAGAIVKARLLQETERRARQLTTLNEMARQLTSTLDLEPLLRNILQSASDILNCDAGSLLLVDEQTEELVFRVTVGPVAEDLVNRRMPPGSGMVGKSVKTRQPVIVNDVAKTPEWFSQNDKQTGFMTRALLVVPMILKDNVLGAIEVLNKRDGSPFNKEDVDLLAAFASQAAVAIDNARLYTLTDKALAARVEELSVMQRIDRELNTSLDTRRAMQITLDWAMRQSDANAGLVGVVQADGINIMASHGYTDELSEYQDEPLPFDSFPLEEAINNGTPQRVSAHDNGKTGLLNNGLSHTIVPIRRETTTIGLIILESTSPEPCTNDALNFLLRLCDHAAIAISNAQLYSAVQSANVAKSEFVSFVSHELKNPMTSIKGYTELLAAGAVGPITEPQANFLSTIRSNVERMATLVSDLADVSRIEAGRLKLDFKSINLVEVTEEVIRSLKRMIEDKGQQLVVNLPENLQNIWADRVRIIQIITNLVSNATKYTPQGGQITVAAEVCANKWDANGAQKVVHMWVQDTGIGINSQDAAKIFQKFFRSEDPKTREVPGTGLGLNITKSLVEMQGGKIWFESEHRKGTTFHFTIPVAE